MTLSNLFKTFKTLFNIHLVVSITYFLGRHLCESIFPRLFLTRCFAHVHKLNRSLCIQCRKSIFGILRHKYFASFHNSLNMLSYLLNLSHKFTSVSCALRQKIFILCEFVIRVDHAPINYVQHKAKFDEILYISQ